jgi:hypothetical protein
LRSGTQNWLGWLVGLAVLAAIVVRLMVGPRSADYLHLDEFHISVTIGHDPTQETGGLTLEFDHIEGGTTACRGVEIQNHGMYVELRLVRASAPGSVQANFPLIVGDGNPRVEIVHDRSRLASKSPVEYRICGGEKDLGSTTTVTPVL